MWEKAFGILQKLLKIAQQSDNVQIMGLACDLQTELTHVREENEQLRKEIDGLKNWKQIDDELELRDNAYWRPSAPNETRRGPFCIRCWSHERVLQPLLVSEMGHQSCPAPDCGGQFPTEASRQAHRAQKARMDAAAQAKRDKLNFQRKKNYPPERYY